MLLCVLLGAVLPNVAAAQQPVRPQPTDTVRPRQQPRDTLPRPTRPDTVRKGRDSVTIAIPATPDSALRKRIDSVPGIRDTLKARVRRDSIQAQLARAEVPLPIGVGPLYRWTRDSVLSTGAINLADLLERVPGLTIFRSGFLASAQTAAYLGDFLRVRVFRDGVELDALDPRAGGVRDVGDIQLTNIDEIAIERTAGEIRIHLRTWTVRNTTPYTRVDAFTGDEDTNLYRFFYGRRFGSGFDAQVGVEQFGTGARNRRTGGGGSLLDALARVGWARHGWSVDAVYTRLDRLRNLTTTFFGQDSVLPRFQGRRNESYLRVGYGQPDSTRLWVQAIASTAGFTVAGTGRKVGVDSAGRLALGKLVTDSLVIPDSSTSRRQYVLTGGYTLRGVRLSGTDRVRALGGRTYNSPSARAEFESARLAFSLFAEHGAADGLVVDSVVRHIPYRADSTHFGTKPGDTTVTAVDSLRRVSGGAVAPPPLTSRVDATVRVSPLGWLALIGAVSHQDRQVSDVASLPTDTGKTVRGPTRFDTTTAHASTTTSRLEAAVRFHRLWLSAGVIRESGGTLLPPPRVYSCVMTELGCGRLVTDVDPTASTGTTVAIRGPFYKDAYLDIVGTGWGRTDAAYRPQYQLRGEVGVQTNWLRRFPSGNFGFKAALIDEYRSRVRFPVAYDSTLTGPLCALQVCVPPTNVVTAQLEIRIQTGVLSYQLRNALNRQYELVPGMRMPGPVSYYGLRWTFWN